MTEKSHSWVIRAIALNIHLKNTQTNKQTNKNVAIEV